MTHDFKKHPELTNEQMGLYYFESPHKQITEDFEAKVVKIIDGDTIRVKTNFRDFDFPVRFSNIMAAELDESGGIAARNFLKREIDKRTIEVLIDKKNRVGKYGRLLGRIYYKGVDIGELMKQLGFARGVDEEKPTILELYLSLGLGTEEITG